MIFLEDMRKDKMLLYLLSYYSNIPLVKPDFINFGLTHRCNLGCNICETWEERPNVEDELILDDLKKTIFDISKWGRINISFAGGEPLIRKDDLLQCIKYASGLGLDTHVTTNGILINDKTAAELVKSGLDYLQVSLDGINEKTNDSIRNDGSYAGAIRAIEKIKKHIELEESDMKLSITTVITDKNIDELLGIYTFVEENDLHEVSFNPYIADNSYTKDKNYEDDDFWVSEENIPKLRRVSDELIKLKKDRGKIGTPLITLKLMGDYFEKKTSFDSGICLAGYSYMYVKPNGEVDVCGKGPSMNVRDSNIRKIWYSLKFAKTRLKITQCKKPCLMLCFPRVRFKDFLK